MIIKKRQLVMATLIIALGSAVFINWYYTKPDNVALEAANGTTESYTESAAKLGEALYVNKSEDVTDEYFSEAELRRSKAHDEAMKILNDIISDGESSEDAVRDATDKRNRMALDIKAETDSQALISARTGSECVVIINNENAEVVVGKDVLNETIIMQIKEILMNQTDISAENITIVELNS